MTPTTPPAIPSDIPRETWNLAARIWAEMRTVNVNSPAEWCEGDVEELARAILAERERCALVAETRFPQVPSYAAEIAAAIRSPVDTSIQSDDPTEPAGDSPNTVASRPNSHAETVG